MIQKLRLAIAKMKQTLTNQKLGFLFYCYVTFGGDKPLPRAMVKPLYYTMSFGDKAFGIISKLLLAAKVLRSIRMIAWAFPLGPLVSATAFSYKVAHAALKVEMQEQKFAM